MAAGRPAGGPFMIACPEFGTVRVRESPRARRASIRVTHACEVEVVVPRRFPRSRVEALVNESRDWIRRTLDRMREERGLIGDHPFVILPAAFDLPALGESWAVDYDARPLRGVRLERPSPGRLVLRGETGDGAACRAALRKWLRGRARETLLPWLAEVARDTGLRHAGASVRGPSTRWASCSARGRLSLSFKLLFLPPPLVRHVLLHELVHTLRPDHSSGFWGLLSMFEPDCRKLEREVRRGWRLVPPWAER